MSISRILLGAAIAAAISIPLAAQQAPTSYHEVACVKVNPGKSAEMEKWIAGADRKLAQSLVDSGAIAGTIAQRTQLPQGSASECDYAFLTFFKGLPPTPWTPEELSKDLQKAGIPMTAGEFLAKRSELATLVYDNITQTQTLVGGPKKGDYLAFNSMNTTDVGACLASEQKVWKPLAEEMVKAGNSDGWVVDVQEFPRVTNGKMTVSTVDLFPSWNAFVNVYPSMMDAWKKVHPDMDFNTTMEQMGKLCSIENTVLYKVVDVTVPAK